MLFSLHLAFLPSPPPCLWSNGLLFPPPRLWSNSLLFPPPRLWFNGLLFPPHVSGLTLFFSSRPGYSRLNWVCGSHLSVILLLHCIACCPPPVTGTVIQTVVCLWTFHVCPNPDSERHHEDLNLFSLHLCRVQCLHIVEFIIYLGINSIYSTELDGSEPPLNASLFFLLFYPHPPSPVSMDLPHARPRYKGAFNFLFVFLSITDCDL